jgi:hypothetical protein
MISSPCGRFPFSDVGDRLKKVKQEYCAEAKFSAMMVDRQTVRLRAHCTVRRVDSSSPIIRPRA